ncbi:hypothetical protein LUZ63_010287 [Rhynchospora breviuscula]|uniref:MENTAL domain-containing protein n=1 Tax=Rhynchospora breviuscula TaxID=2022672 RepID=A0A9Q0CHI1_9POAL|nr:hypothetical protein LUZ63_010287 [Rhynchospora breviuscula]
MEKKLFKERLWARPWRWIKTLFFLISMLASLLLVCAPPLLIILLDLFLPPTLASTSFRNNPNFNLSIQIKNFNFRASLIDLPLISIARSLLILCVYAICDGRGAYLGVTTLCSLASAGYVFAKAVAMFGFAAASSGAADLWWRLNSDRRDETVAVEALFLTSLSLALAHIVVAYRTSCRERRKLMVYRIDIEAVKLKTVQIKGVLR